MFIRALTVLGAKDKTGNGPICPGYVAEIDDDLGASFVQRGVALEVPHPDQAGGNPGAPAPVPGENPSEDENTQNGALNPENEITETEDLGKLEDMRFDQLKQIAKDLGIATGKIKSKEGMIAAISEVATGIPADEEPPVFEAQEVVE